MKNLFALLLLQCIIISLSAQDLIERTQQNKTGKIAINNQNNPSRLAELVSKNKKYTKTSAAVNVFTFNENRTAKTTENVSKSVELSLEKSAINQLLKEKRQGLTLKIPVNQTKYFELELVRQTIQKSSYKITLSDKVDETYQPADMVFYKGIIKNDHQSLAAVTISNNQIRVLASDKDGNYVVGKLPNTTAKYVLYNDVHLKQNAQFTCGTSDIPQEGSVEANTAGTTTVNGQCVPVYIEADFAFYQDNNSSVSNVEVYLNGLFNEVETIYFNESIGVGISEIFVHTSPDPFMSANNTEDALDLFVALRQNNFNGRLAHLVSGRSLGGGIAYVDVLCSININHAVSALNSNYSSFPTYSWDLYVFAHEMGHNFGSWHTHSCVWNGNNTAIDGCAGFTDRGDCSLPGIPSAGGTIMSYCHFQSAINFSLGFGPQPGNLIRNRFSNSPCILACEESCNYEGNPCNFIPNPNFDDGFTGWDWWNNDISTPSGICKIENIVAGENVWDSQVLSDYLCLVQGVTYRVSFDAYSESPRDFYAKVGLGAEPWTNYLYQPVNTTTYFQNYSYEFTQTNPSTSIGRLEFHVSGTGNLATLYIDNIVLQPIECSGNEVCEILENGDFTNGLNNWVYWGMPEPSTTSGECFLSKIQSEYDYAESWTSALGYYDMTLEQNQTYTIQFRARSVNSPRTFIIKTGLGIAPWTSYLWETVNLTTQMQTFSYTFTMPEPTISVGSIEFQVGESDIELYVDDVSFTETDCESVGLSNACIENINLEGISDEHIYHAGVKITSKAEISNTNVSYFAGDNISLDIGFKVENGAVFNGAIQGCD